MTRDGRAGAARGRRAVVGLVAAAAVVVVGLGVLATHDRAAPPDAVDVRSEPARAEASDPSTAPPPPSSPSADDAAAAAVAQGMVDGALVFAGTEPSCTVARDGSSGEGTPPVEFACVLGRLPTAELIVDHTGVLESYVDDQHRVAGACQGQDRDGRTWTCLAGEAAVEAGYLRYDLLGQPQPVPGRG